MAVIWQKATFWIKNQNCLVNLMKFYIVRHGETENNRKKLFQGWIDAPLTPEGVANAEVSGTKLKSVRIDKIVSSDLGRAFTSAYIIARKLGYIDEIERTSGLREINYGDFANKTYDVYPELTPEENADFVLPNGESLRQMQQRVLAEISRIADDYPDKTVLLVAHDGTINAIRSKFSGEDIGVADLTRNPHEYVATFDFRENHIVSFGEVTNVGDFSPRVAH
jgi:alpha-ribazole phosphatase